jgi:hypothetical protein
VIGAFIAAAVAIIGELFDFVLKNSGVRPLSWSKPSRRCSRRTLAAAEVKPSQLNA